MEYCACITLYKSAGSVKVRPTVTSGRITRVASFTGFTVATRYFIWTYIFQMSWPVPLQLWRILRAGVTFFSRECHASQGTLN